MATVSMTVSSFDLLLPYQAGTAPSIAGTLHSPPSIDNAQV